MTTASAMVWITMNPTVFFMVAGDPATMWRHIAAVDLVDQVEAVTLIDQRLLPTRCRPFPRTVAAVVVALAAGDVELFANLCSMDVYFGE